MPVGKQMRRIGGQHIVEIDTDIRKFTKNRGGKTKLRFQEISSALMSQSHSDATRRFFADTTENKVDDVDRLMEIQFFRNRLLS